MKKRIKKFILVSIVASEIIFLNISPALAIHIPSASEIASDIENRYHLNTGSIQNMGESFNVSEQKTTSPQVTLFFNPTDPKPGEKITAQALPTYFSTPKEALYYTWYLKHDGCKADDSPSSGTITKCDRDGDNKITVNDWKIEAMTILANSGYDTRRGDYSSDSDSDGFTARWGGADKTDATQERRTSYCYIHDFSDGKNYELATTSGGNLTCSSGTAVCAEDDNITCPGTIEATGGTGGSGGSGGAGGDDPTGGSGGTGGTGGTVSGETFIERKTCYDTGDAPSCDANTNEPVCAIGTPYCVNTSDDNLDGDCDSTFGTGAGEKGSCSSFSFSAPTCSGQAQAVTTENKCYNLLSHHLFPYYKDKNVTRLPGDFPGISHSGLINLCDTKDSDGHCYDVDGNNAEVGDGKFGKLEESFWYTNPNDPDTADNGNRDEANVVGVGQYQFSWNYQDGDKVGVAIEGASMIPTKHDNSSMMIMWALPKNNCSVKGKSSYYEVIKGYNVEIDSFDPGGYQNFFDKCLEDNLVDPKEGQQPKKIDVSLSYSPENPINDATGNALGDDVIVQSTMTNSDQESSQLLYNWEVAISPDGNIPFTPSGWKTICKNSTDKDANACILEASTLRGLSLSSFQLKLNLTEDDLKNIINQSIGSFFPDGTGYLKVSLTVSENYPEESQGNPPTREGRSDVIIKVSSTDKQIRVFTPKVDSVYLNEVPLSHGPLELDASGEFCNDQESLGNCLIAKNEIVGLKIDNDGNKFKNFSWTLDGEPLVCDSATVSYENCLPSQQTNVNFFPVTGDPGKTYTVSVTANNVDTGKTINLTRNFKVVEPFVNIVSDDQKTAWQKYLGIYVDLNENQFADFSESLLQTLSGNKVRLNAQFHPSWLASFSDFDWTLDGSADNFTKIMNTSGKPEAISFTADKLVGQAYNAAIEAAYQQPREIRKALSAIWNVSQFDSAEKNMSAAIQIEVVAGEDDLSLTNHPGKFIAGLLSHLPAQLMFLLRIILTISVILISTGIVFSFIPETYGPRKPFYGKD